jgi:hypothetical protein
LRPFEPPKAPEITQTLSSGIREDHENYSAEVSAAMIAISVKTWDGKGVGLLTS